MFKLRTFVSAFIAFVFASTSLASSQTDGSFKRPPQYVLLAFDGSLNLGMWNETLNFAQTNKLKFTYFISGVYFLLDQNKSKYIEPTHGIGKSSIGWGGSSAADIRTRVGYVNQAYDAGNEIASHVNGHFDGSKWTLAQWQSEFRQFTNLIFNVFRLNGIDLDPRANPYHFVPKQVVGFRAPLLGVNPSMFQALKENNYTYDTSRVAPMNYWPQRLNGIWNFPLAEVRIAGTGKKTLSMDYNFYYSQSAGQPKPQNYAQYKNEMLKTYMGYFENNYYGNRAPIHIGHHFSKWNGGAYWDAMQTFAKAVCGRPEVKCVTYSELMGFMNSLTSVQIAGYQAGRFDKMAAPAEGMRYRNLVRPLDVKMAMNSNDDGGISAMVNGGDSGLLPNGNNSEYVWKVDEQVILRTRQGHLSSGQINQFVEQGQKLSVSYENQGQELLKASHLVTDVSDEAVQFSSDDLEAQALMGDSPHAHGEE